MLKKKLILSAVFFLIIILFFVCVQSISVFTLVTDWIRSSVLTKKSEHYKEYSDIPDNLKNGIVTIEDKRFWQHFGVDPIALLRSVYQTIRYDRIQWWSTIDQQLIKITEQHYERTVLRKLYEWRWALNLQFHYSKEAILLSYVNSIPFSHGIVWWKAACDIYLHKSCELLSDAEFSYLLAISQLGTNPYKKDNQTIILSRAKNICKKLIPKNITSAAWCEVLSESIVLDYYEPLIDPKVISFLSSEDITKQQSFQLNTYTSINGILQTTKPLRDQYNVKDCCIVLLNSSWDVVSMNMCSSRDDEAWKINLCLKPRQTWSAIKPFLYIYALRTLWLNPKDTIVDEPIAYDLWDGSMYEPKNFDLRYHGRVSLAYALGNSLNIPAIQLLERVWVKSFLDFLQEYIQYFAPDFELNDKSSSDVWLSLALGTYEISPYVFTQLRRMLLLSETPAEYLKQSQEIISVLSDPIYKVSSFGQDSFLNTRGWAVKTGTSRKFIDGWVCGANNAKWLTLCIRMGNYNNEAMKWPSGEVGSYVWKLITDIL